MKNIKLVIGANWGDEGKGLMTDYFANKAKENNQSCLVVCHNGGSQKGHTTMTLEGIRHIFHHFGAGAFVNADTYLAETYILNPMTFRKEFDELKEKGGNTTCFINRNSLFTTPYDMLINQFIEQTRGKDKHGSCGLGIFETVHRSDYEKLTIGEFFDCNYNEKIQILKNIRDYYLNIRMKELNIYFIDPKFIDLFMNEQLMINYLDDLEFFIKKTKFINNEILYDYDTIIFEGAQGLALDQNNKKYWPNLTPSNTGSKNPIDILSNLSIKDVNIEVCYITRSYYTRHGAGEFEFSCKKEDINPDIVDLTNVPNPFQETIRYGYIDLDDLYERIFNDYKQIPFNTNLSLAITHLNYTNNKFATKDGLKDIPNTIKNIYLSNGQTNQNVAKKIL